MEKFPQIWQHWLEEKLDKILAKLQLMLYLFSAGKFKLKNQKGQKAVICFK